MFIAVLFTITNLWKQPMPVSLSIYICIYQYNGILIRHKKEGLPFMATRMEGVNKSDRERQTLYVWNLKNIANLYIEPKKCNKLVHKTSRSRFTDTEKKLVLTTGEKK